MAARKSCTHLTWSEAKARAGQATKGQHKNKEVLRKQNHGAVLANKIIAKQGGDVAASESKKLQKQYRKQEEKAAAIAAARHEEREQKRLAALQEVRPYDRAREKVAEMLSELRDSEGSIPKVDTGNINLSDEETQAKIAECKQMQLDEIMALEAMIPEEDFVISNASRVTELREKLETLACDDGDDAIRLAIANHPPLSYTIRLEVDDYRDADEETADMDLNVILLLRVTLPPLYLSSEASQIPVWDFEFIMVTDKNIMCSADKALESLSYLDETGVKEAMSKQAEELLPYPCVYELAVTWLSENVFGYLHFQSHLLATKQ